MTEDWEAPPADAHSAVRYRSSVCLAAHPSAQAATAETLLVCETASSPTKPLQALSIRRWQKADARETWHTMFGVHKRGESVQKRRRRRRLCLDKPGQMYVYTLLTREGRPYIRQKALFSFRMSETHFAWFVSTAPGQMFSGKNWDGRLKFFSRCAVWRRGDALFQYRHKISENCWCITSAIMRTFSSL